jgi:hypothetical protein
LLARLLPKKIIPSDLGTYDAYDAATSVMLQQPHKAKAQEPER